MVNVHASLLPKYRGAAPVHRAVIDGEIETGVTIMRVVAALDAGPMFAKVSRPIGPDETSDVVEEALAHLGADLLVRVVDEIAAGAAREEPQDPARANYAPRLTKEEGLIDWSQSASSIHNRVRGLHPWPHAHTYLDGARLIVLRTRSGHTHPGGPRRVENSRSAASPGTIVEVTREAIQVSTGDGELAIVELQAEGRRPMHVREFLAGHVVKQGAVFAGS
jgi:methionyl-tRNA formyltransferase